MKRVYHTWDKWECYPAGFYENNPPAGMTPRQATDEYAVFLRDIPRFEAALERVISEWNRLYDSMHLAGLTPHQMRICQPYGDDQRRGLWLYHLIEPESWYRVVARVNGVNSGALYINETGNMTGYNQITKPEGHTWESFCRLLLGSLPAPTREHYLGRFRTFIRGWKGRGYRDGLPDEAPRVLENKHWAPSWRRLCRVLLRNDWWCKGLGLQQPKSKAYQEYLEMRREKLGQLPLAES